VLDQIQIWFSILQRKLLQPNHFVSVAALEQAIAAFIARYNQTAKPIMWTYTVEKLERKLGMHLRAIWLAAGVDPPHLLDCTPYVCWHEVCCIL